MVEKLNSWHKVIKHYIDDLKEHGNQQLYIDELVAIFLSKQLGLVTVSQEDQREFKRLIQPINKKPPTSKNRPLFEKAYQQLLEKEWISDFSLPLQRINNKTDFYNIWICRSVELSGGVMPATHAAKLSHSKSSGSSILDYSNNQKEGYLTTSSLKRKIVDGTYVDAKFSRQIKFLLLRHNETYLFDAIYDTGNAELDHFAESPEELNTWLSKYRDVLAQIPRTDTLLKQIYFPIEPQKYHLLSVLKSSSLAQKIYDSHFSKDAQNDKKSIDKARKNNKYAEGNTFWIPDVNKLMTTQSQPQNATTLNGKRRGAIRLLSCQPPVWKSNLKPPIYHSSLFQGIHAREVRDDIEYLRNFLMRNERLDLSIRDPQKRQWLIKWGQHIIDTVLFYVQEVQKLPAGWSNVPDIKLKQAHQYFLDPYREDEAFQAARKGSNWQEVISQDFAVWLNSKLPGKDKQFTPQPAHRKLWTLLMADALRELTPALEVKFKQKPRGDA
ncbi:type I-F CRISPR-associated protein Csy1 [Endozoicomonas sp. ALB032]|uniref:type I-F CRISPR-associated protein Csy1 n=1 Tax=Endozoicomonas sp. ALB032 TaxID=3403082 RepID=UPI003BB79265